MTMIGDEEEAKPVVERILERMGHMTQEDWDRVFENLRNRNNIT